MPPLTVDLPRIICNRLLEAAPRQHRHQHIAQQGGRLDVVVVPAVVVGGDGGGTVVTSSDAGSLDLGFADAQSNPDAITFPDALPQPDAMMSLPDTGSSTIADAGTSSTADAGTSTTADGG
jgi:hypothetical protein